MEKNIFAFFSSKHILVFKTSSKRLQRNNFLSSKTSWRRPANTSWRRLEDVLKTSWKTKNCYAEAVLKMSWRHVLKTSWRKAKYLLGISVSNKSKCVSNKSTFDNSKANPKRIKKNPSIQYLSYFGTQAASLF